jgi:hypothetical protein
MVSICQQCGAGYNGNEDCNERFSYIMAKKFEYPATYGAMHRGKAN